MYYSWNCQTSQDTYPQANIQKLIHHKKQATQNSEACFINIVNECYLIIENPPIAGSFFISPLAAFIIPIIARIIKAIEPKGKIINHPIKGKMLPTILTAIAAKRRINC